MKKLLLGIAGILAMVSSANAAESTEALKTLTITPDTSKIQAACESSDKTLWDNRNKVCIPRNPCKNSKYESYCNRTFKDVETPRGYPEVYLNLINIYTKNHDVSCEPIQKEYSSWVGESIDTSRQDYVICKGQDVMVFEFDDITDQGEAGLEMFKTKSYLSTYAFAICDAMGGVYDEGMSFCRGVTERVCIETQNYIGSNGGYLRSVQDGKYRLYMGWTDEDDINNRFRRGCNIFVVQESDEAWIKTLFKNLTFH